MHKSREPLCCNCMPRTAYVISVNRTRFRIARQRLVSVGFLPQRAYLADNTSYLLNVARMYSLTPASANYVSKVNTLANLLSHLQNWNRSRMQWTYMFEDDVKFNFDITTVQSTLDLVENMIRKKIIQTEFLYLQRSPTRHPMFTGPVLHATRMYGTMRNHTIQLQKCATNINLGGAHAYAVSSRSNMADRVWKETFNPSLHSQGTLRYFIDDRIKYYFGKMRRSTAWRNKNWPVCVTIDNEDPAVQANYGHNRDHECIQNSRKCPQRRHASLAKTE